MKYQIRLYVLILLLLVPVGNWLSPTANAHDLKVTVTRPGPPPGPTIEEVELPVDHMHECVRKAISEVVTGSDGLVDEIRVIYEHRKVLTPADIARIKRQGEAWIAANGEGNIIYASDPTNEKNCHGVTFDGGNSWVNKIEPYLQNCTPWSPPPAKPPVGTVVVYRKDGRITHSGKVIETPAGKDGVWVHSQWGHWGDFDHKVDKVHEIYGTGSYYTCP